MPMTELFSPRETDTLLALADRIVPPDWNGPGGADGGAVTHLLRELAPGGALSDRYDACLLFLLRLNEEGGGNFSALPPTEQDAMLTRLEAEPETARLFRQIVEWVTEGFYAGPAGWALVGFRPVDRETR